MALLITLSKVIEYLKVHEGTTMNAVSKSEHLNFYSSKECLEYLIKLGLAEKYASGKITIYKRTAGMLNVK